MSDSDRGKRFEAVSAAGFCGLAILGLCALIFAIGDLNGRQAESRQASPHEHAETAKSKAKRACVGTEPTAVFECVYDAIEASEDTARTEQDLTAQQRAAWAAVAGSAIAALALLATVIGLFYVRETLRATLTAVEDTSEATEAMREANKIALNEQRPWLEFEIEIHRGIFAHDNFSVVYTLSIRNIGKLPAQNVIFRKIEDHMLSVFNEKDRKTNFDEIIDPEWKGTNILPGGVVRYDISSPFPRDKWVIFPGAAPAITPLIGICVSYKWAGEPNFHRTGEWVHIFALDPSNPEQRYAIPIEPMLSGQIPKLGWRRTHDNIAT